LRHNITKNDLFSVNGFYGNIFETPIKFAFDVILKKKIEKRKSGLENSFTSPSIKLPFILLKNPRFFFLCFKKKAPASSNQQP
jgi:hypothetical protein